ncbi:MAG: ROK family protein [Proteobacteria bacterium]|nr:ROK family protein [Pseudomonadota bacterium]
MSEKYLLGFDVGGTNARCALILNNAGQFRILSTQKHAIRAARSPRDIASLIRHILETNIADNDLNANDIAGIGIALAGQIDIDEHTVINAPNLDWHHVNFYDILLAELHSLAPHITVRIANDLNAIAWGEYNFGAARQLKNLLAVYVGTGIGAGIIIDGKLMLGANNVSGEIGHSKFPNLHNLPCGCGQHGCVEAFAGGKAIEYRILHDIQIGTVSRADLELGPDEHPTARTIEQACKRDLPYAIHFWKETSHVLGALIANAISLLNPDALLLGGGVIQGCPKLTAMIIEHIMQFAPKAATANLQLIKPALHDDAGTLGAALLCSNTTMP